MGDRARRVTGGGLDVLPRFRVERVDPDADGSLLVRGVAEGRRPGEGPAWFWLWLSEDDAVTPSIVEDGASVLIRIDADDVGAPMAAGDELPWQSPHWDAAHVHMIRRGAWRPQVFAPRDAVHFELDGIVGWGPAEQGVPEGAEPTGVEPGGWDHEHCEICRATIGVGGLERGYVDPDGHWLCPSCHDRWAEPRDLGFLVDPA